MRSSLTVLTGEQIRAGRALVRIDQSELATRCRLSLETIKRLERIRGPVEANSRTLRALIEAFSEIGVKFGSCDDGGMGICLAPTGASRARGQATGPARDTARRAAATSLHRLIYHSVVNPANPRPLHVLLDQIQASGAKREATMDVTGILFAQGGRFLSVLEGPKESVRQVYGAISCDSRHASLSIISDQAAAVRHFQDWSVSCGRFESDAGVLASEPALRDGFRPESLSPASALGLLSVMKDLKDVSPRSDLDTRSPCPLAGICLDRVCASEAAAPGA